MRRSILILFLLGLISFGLAQEREVEELPEAVIKERYIGRIEESRPMLSYQFDPYFDVGKLLGRAYVLDRRLDESIERMNTKLLSLHSDYLRVPVVSPLVDLTQSRLQVSIPRIPGRPARWELKITDSRGQLFKQIEGRGPPPQRIEWDGRGDRGELFTVGAIYSYELEMESEVGTRERRILEPLRIPGVIAEGPLGSRIISIDSRVLFQGSAFRPEATPYLETAANLIKECSASSATVAAYSQAQAQRVGSFLKERIPFLQVEYRRLDQRYMNLDISF